MKDFSPAQRELMFDLMAACSTGCATEDDFRCLVRTVVQPLIPHRSAIAVLGSLSFEHLSLRHIVGIDCSPGLLAAIPRDGRLAERQAIREWMQHRRPFVIDLSRGDDGLSRREIDEIETFQLGRIAAHGQIDLSAQMATYFSFTGLDPGVSDAQAHSVLGLIAPHLHSAFIGLPSVRLLDESVEPLTVAERDVLRWMAAGRSNAEIAELRGRSLSTVRNQISAIFRKIGASNRAEAVMKFATSGRTGI
jgi:DNA-binding CsgD family transcriptional regulator